MEVVLLTVLGAVFLVPLALLVKLAWRSEEECPEAEPDLSDEERVMLEDRMLLREWSKSNKWEQS